MWLFGIVTMMEMNITEYIRTWLADKWQVSFSQSRLNKARVLQTERLRLGQQVDLLDCLQLTDKAKIMISSVEEIERLGFTSKAEADKFARQLESLRNHLAHGQLIADSNWPQIVELSTRLEDVIKNVVSDESGERDE